MLDLDRETAETQKLYGLDQPETENYGRQCLMMEGFTREELGDPAIAVTRIPSNPNQHPGDQWCFVAPWFCHVALTASRLIENLARP